MYYFVKELYMSPIPLSYTKNGLPIYNTIIYREIFENEIPYYKGMTCNEYEVPETAIVILKEDFEFKDN